MLVPTLAHGDPGHPWVVNRPWGEAVSMVWTEVPWWWVSECSGRRCIAIRASGREG